MKKYLMIFTLLFSLIFMVSKLNKTQALEEYNFNYKIIANSNSIDDLVNLYETKEILIINYNNALENELDILKVYNEFYNGEILLKEDTFYITLGEGKGISLEGKLKTSVCDNNTINNRIALLEWLSNLK